MTIITRENYGNDNNHNNALRIDKQWCVCMCIYIMFNKCSLKTIIINGV